MKTENEKIDTVDKELIKTIESFDSQDPFIEHNLFEPPPDWKIVNLYRKQLIDFRNNYRLLGEFAAHVCGVPIEKFCKLDMINYICKHEET